MVEASSALYFWDHHTPIQIVAKPTEALDTALVYLSLANPVLKPEVCRNQGLVHHNLNSLHEMPIPTVNINKSQHLHNVDAMVPTSVWVLTTP